MNPYADVTMGGRRKRQARTEDRTTRVVAGLAVALVAASVVGCTGEASSAQEAAVVPTEESVLADRVDRARVRGSADAPVRMVEVSDFQCPYCAEYHRETFAGIDSLYIQTGQVNYVWVSYPNPGHARAWPAIEAAFCAGAVGQFWPMHDLLFERQGEWTQVEDPFTAFVGYATELGIDRESYADCLRNDRVAPLQVRDYQNVVRAGIGSTPYFILADSIAIRGAAPLENFQSAIDSLLARRGAAERPAEGSEEEE